jgi:SAM-dependent methyltransferase
MFVSDLTQLAAQDWITRWDRQQEGYVPDREERFTTLLDAVEAGSGRADPLVLDLGCGPGSLSVRLLTRLPKARVIAIDTDPLLLELGRAAASDRPGLRFTDLDLRTPGWSARLELDRAVDVAVSTTALHWLPEPYLRAMYAELATVLRPGGLLLNGDNFTVHGAPTLARLEDDLVECAKDRYFTGDRPEDWAQWWEAVAHDPTLSELNAQRATIEHHGSESGQLMTHVDALRDAGFHEIGTLWQRGNNRLLAAIRG